ncbi:MAG TPA: ribosome recycling factor [Verrucomicrobiales bacterium]|jgi:ribosome recycling factor|nr:ribosome recycling factor [Verrucomicrobiales bacterium]HBU59499.1 ribosome recycling factor [Verrucomicrobiales bacterium]|tara:strand:- start:20 stop:583 length:564 start_codon:yes stop_codon:yes gene_type:complete
MPVDDILLQTEEKMQKSEEVVLNEFSGVRTGKASPALVENINIEAYEGSSMRLKELAAITAPEMRTLVIQPWDASTVTPIEKGLQAANLGLNPAVDGKLIRINLPDLSKERRQEMVKAARKLAEDGRVSVRHVRREALESLKAEQKNGEITEDDLSHGEKEVQKLTDNYVKKIDDHLSSKEEEILTV